MFALGEYSIVCFGLVGLLLLAASVEWGRKGRRRLSAALAAGGMGAVLLFAALLLTRLVEQLLIAVHTFRSP